MRFWKSAVCLILFSATALAPAATLAFNTRITVYATVAEMRVIYVDDSGNIVKVAGNTTRNIEPQVLDSQNHQITMDQKISDQYNQFLNDHGGQIEASKIYMVNPVKVNTLPNAQSISLPGPTTGKLSLSL